MTEANLNPEQKEAVEWTEGPLLILAGAGSGKTRVLTYRIAHLIHRKGVSPRNILAITFTNKAAQEMKERVERFLGYDSRDLWVCTFHSACVRILRMEIEKLGYGRNFVIYDSADQQTLLKNCLKELNIDDKKYPPRAMQVLISQAKNGLQDPAAFKRQAQDYYQEVGARVYELYQHKLKENNAMDFDDLIMKTVELFEKFAQVLDYYQERFKYILVDEYQDTNHAQYRLIRLLAAKYRNLCVVGDDDQSVYGWRGADIQNILDFERDYPEARVIKLEQNYRSTKNILAAANHVVKRNIGRKEKSLWTENEEGLLPVFFRAQDQYQEAYYIAERIYRLHLEEDRPYRDFAVLYRTNAQSRVIEEVFIKNGIPYTIVGGLKFYERKEIKDILAYLRVISNPADNISLQRIINVPRRGIGDTTMGKIAEYANYQGISHYEALIRAEEIPGLTGRSLSPVKKFGQLIEAFRQTARHSSVTELVNEVLQQTGYIRELEAEKSVEAQTRLENIKEFLSVTKEFDARAAENRLEDFLAEVSLISDVDEYTEGADAVVLMTLHSAKGLEFPVVFIAGMEEGIFPHSRSMLDNSQLEEERRLCYVGITRAKERLYLTAAWERNLFGNTMFNPVSRFIEEIPPALLDTEGGERRRHEQESREMFRGSRDKDRRSSFADRAHVSPVGSYKIEDRPKESFFHLGDKVQHSKWGVGVVVAVNGKGEDAELSIAFPDLGIKKLMVRYAPLKKVSG
ncbi:DNA helicase PcrA [Thermincola potens]|uniref:ATP-dependent DNA helicase n=1 Tax=Thermincola potens (strain JR) TaxID=635013 RepID=D5XD67_THEPJ|nr:DNA helicase PcrA [Thermincola potens]ADG81715.1 ATP-dependent DNA helicase PcrA [Thermincola potens JR]